MDEDGWVWNAQIFPLCVTEKSHLENQPIFVNNNFWIQGHLWTVTTHYKMFGPLKFKILC